MTTTKAPRAAAVDTDDAVDLANGVIVNLQSRDLSCQAGFETPNTVVLALCYRINTLAADLDATRAERDAARETLERSRDVGERLTTENRSLCDALERAEEREAELTQERDAALAALPDAGLLNGAGSLARLCAADYQPLATALFAAADRIRALDTAPAPVPAADVPPFLAHRLNGGQ